MFGFSISKLLVTILLMMAVWYGFKLISKGDRAGDQKMADKSGPSGSARKTFIPVKDVETDAEDLVQCEVCKSYVAANGARNCGQENCPYPASA